METKVSVLMPVYNASLYLKEAIESVLKQTFVDFELIIIDDGSTDDSFEIVKNYKDDRIRLFQNNHNFIATLNEGIAMANGKYIARMDADDVMLPCRLDTQVEFMEQHPEIDLCGSFAQVLGGSYRIVSTCFNHNSIVSSFLLHNSMIHPSIIAKRNVLTSIKYRDGYLCAEDYKLWTDLSIAGFRFANIPEVLLLYRSSEKQVTSTKWKEMLFSVTKIKLEYAEQIIKQIVETHYCYNDFFDNLIELLNTKKISIEHFQNIVYEVYFNILSESNTFNNSKD